MGVTDKHLENAGFGRVQKRAFWTMMTKEKLGRPHDPSPMLVPLIDSHMSTAAQVDTSREVEKARDLSSNPPVSEQVDVKDTFIDDFKENRPEVEGKKPSYGTW